MTAWATGRAVRPVALGAVLALGLLVRLGPVPETFTAGGVRFRGDSDPYYHALRARRLLADWPRIPWRDPYMDYPSGADIPWPPLFDAVIAGAARLAGAAADRPARLDEVAALVPLLFGLALLLSVAAVARVLLGGDAGILSALLVALLPASLRFSTVGAADQHVAELLFATWIVHGFLGTWSDGPRAARCRAAGLLAGATVLAFWNWQGSALALVPVLLWAGVWHVAAPPGDSTGGRAMRGLTRAGLAATVALAATVVAFGPPGAFSRASLSGIGVSQLAACAILALFGGLLTVAARCPGARGRVRRAGEVVAAATLAVAATLLVAPVRGGFEHGVVALGAANPWYRTIDEFRPLFQGAESAAEVVVMSMAGFGSCLLAAPVAALAVGRWWRRAPEDHPRIAFLALWAALFLALALVRKRFALYLVVPLALCWEVAAREVAQGASRRGAPRGAFARRAVLVAVTLFLVGPALPMVWIGGYVAPDRLQDDVLIPLARELRTMGEPAGRPAVMGPWSAGHVLQYFADKPVVATPFGTDLGPEGMRDLARFQLSREPEDVEEILSRRRVGFVLVQAPGTAGGAIPGVLAQPGPPSLDARLVTSRLYRFDGLARRGEPLPTLEPYRLLAESTGDALAFGATLPGPPYKLFGVVPGVRLTVRDLSPGPVVVATLVVTNRGRTFEWTTSADANEQGVARLRLPYATGRNGLSRAGPYRVSQAGRSSRTLEIGEDQVLLGAHVETAIPR